MPICEALGHFEGIGVARRHQDSSNERWLEESSLNGPNRTTLIEGRRMGTDDIQQWSWIQK